MHPPRACERTGERERHSKSGLLAIGTSVSSPRNVKLMFCFYSPPKSPGGPSRYEEGSLQL
eukprot:407396-Prymnesium_polylepis.1